MRLFRGAVIDKCNNQTSFVSFRVMFFWRQQKTLFKRKEKRYYHWLHLDSWCVDRRNSNNYKLIYESFYTNINDLITPFLISKFCLNVWAPPSKNYIILILSGFLTLFLSTIIGKNNIGALKIRIKFGAFK